MAAPGENLLSVGHLSGMELNTLTKKRELLIKKSREMQLQRLQELKERERRAQQDHRQLLLQFERAQDTLTEMLARNAAMKIIRMEYERYLEENFYRWQIELKEKTQGSQKTQRMEDSLKSFLRKNKNQASTATAHQPLISQDPSLRVPRFAAPQKYSSAENSACSQDNSSYPLPDASWLTQAGLLHGSLRAPLQPQSPPPFPAANFLYSHPFLLQHPTSSLDHHQPWAMPEAAGLAPSRHSNLCADGIPQRSSSRLHTEEPSALRVDGEDEVSTESSNRVRGGGGRRGLSPELDAQPVRLSSEHAASSESGRDSSLTSREKKKREKKGRAKSSSSESEICSSQKTSSEVGAASCTQTNSSSEEGATTGRRRTKRGRGLHTGSPPSEKEKEEQKQSEKDEKSVSLSARSPGQNSKSGSCRGMEGSDRDVVKGDNREEDVDDEEEAYSSERSNTEEKDEEEGEKSPESGDEEKEVKSEEGSEVVEDEVPPTSRNGKKSVEEDEENSDEQENEDGENREQDSSSSQGEDEEESEGGERIEQPDEEEEAGDSEDSIISPQKTRSKQMKNIPEEAEEDEEKETDTQSSDNNSQESSDEEDIENLLAPQPGNKKENAVKSDGKPKATCPNFGIFQATEDGAKTNHKSDSDEFDHFYD